MTAMRPANCGNFGRMAGGREPVMDRRSNTAALHRRLTLAMMARNQEKNSLAARNRLVEAAVDCSPGAIEVHAMQIEDSIRFNGAVPQSLVPSAVERSFADRHGFLAFRCCALDGFYGWTWLAVDRFGTLDRLGRFSFPGQGTNGRRHPCPEFCLFRVESSHGNRRPLAPRSVPRHWRTCRRPLQPLQALRPKRYQIDWDP